MRFLLPTVSIDGINLFMTGIKVKFHQYLVFHIGQENFNAPKRVFCAERSAISQSITCTQSMMI